MTGLYIFGVLIIAGFVTLMAFKVKWSRKAAREWAITVARNNNLAK